jgi:ribonuclease HII
MIMFASVPNSQFLAALEAPSIVAGVDEAGRGPLAGPVVAAAVVLGKHVPSGITDSKKLTEKKRSLLDPQIRESCAWGVAVIEPEEIDRLNIFGATMRAMAIAVERLAEALGQGPDLALIDGNLTPQGRTPVWRWPAQAIVKGDEKEASIGAASIIAKCWRDRIMCEAAQEHPHYGWERNKGYGSKEHMEALRMHGPTPLHRRSFAPVAQLDLYADLASIS